VRKILTTVAAVLAAAFGLMVGVEAPAQASVPASYCDGRSQVSLVKTYPYGAQRLGLRCGTASWGFVHIKHRWNAAFDSMIALTIARGEKVTDVQQDGGTRIFALFDNGCHELFRVIYNGSALHGTGVSPQGIITAYYRDVVVAAARPMTREAAAAPSYRTDCAVIQNI
jgi:hypothetical protein